MGTRPIGQGTRRATSQKDMTNSVGLKRLTQPGGVTITLRGAFIGGLAVALCVGLYLFWLWLLEHQIRLHTEHFVQAIGGREWEAVANVICDNYSGDSASYRTS